MESGKSKIFYTRKQEDNAPVSSFNVRRNISPERLVKIRIGTGKEASTQTKARQTKAHHTRIIRVGDQNFRFEFVGAVPKKPVGGESRVGAVN